MEPSPNPQPSSDRWAVLAGVRFALAVVVASGHLAWFGPTSRPFAALAGLGGTAAVLGFLVISGYAIAHSLAARPTGFYRRRLARIYPLYAVAIVYALLPFAVGAAAFVPRPTAWTVAGNLLLLQSVACLPISSDLVLWTLSVEAACYAAAPPLRRCPTAALLGMLTVSAVAFAVVGHGDGTRFGLPLLLFAWAWVAGFLMHRLDAGVRGGLAVAAVGGVLLWVRPSPTEPGAVPTFALAAVVVAVAGRVAVRPSLARGLNLLGDVSYPLYLFHLPTFLLAYCFRRRTGPTALMVAAVAVSAVALAADVAVKAAVTRRSPRRLVPTRPPAGASAGEDRSPVP